MRRAIRAQNYMRHLRFGGAGQIEADRNVERDDSQSLIVGVNVREN